MNRNEENTKIVLRRPILVLGVLLGAANCDGSLDLALAGACTDALQELPKDAVEAADRAVKAGDLRLIAVNDYSRRTPGTNDPRLRQKHGIIVLEETSDTPADHSCQTYQKVATDYAEKYNQQVLMRASRKPEDKPTQ
jgi:hypothetical protein